MPLNWSIAKVQDWKELAEDDMQRVITDAIVWHTLGIDMGEITEANWPEVAARIRFNEKLIGAMCTHQGEEYYITPEDVKRRIGLSTNVITKGRGAWLLTYMSCQVQQLVPARDDDVREEPWNELRLLLEAYDADPLWDAYGRLKDTPHGARLRDLVDKLSDAWWRLGELAEDQAWRVKYPEEVGA